MNSRLSCLAAAACLLTAIPAQAIELEGERPSASAYYAPTVSAIKKTLDKMRLKYEVVKKDQLLRYTIEGGLIVHVGLNSKSSGKLYNVQMISQFGTKPSRYDDLVAYANKWNKEKKQPKVLMFDNDSLRLIFNYPVEYGFSPDEFEDNVVGTFERTLRQIKTETSDMRR